MVAQSEKDADMRQYASIVLSILLLAGVFGVKYYSRFRRLSKGIDGPSRSTELPATLRAPRIEIQKRLRVLMLYDGEDFVQAYMVGLGTQPVGHKLREGDGRTPEGTYYVCMKNTNSKFHMSLGLSYPGTADAARGLREGIISRVEHDAIVAAIKAGQQPLWNTALGGEICIHGNGAGSDWTQGCIALDNKNIEKIFKLVPLGTPVTILP